MTNFAVAVNTCQIERQKLRAIFQAENFFVAKQAMIPLHGMTGVLGPGIANFFKLI